MAKHRTSLEVERHDPATGFQFDCNGCGAVAKGVSLSGPGDAFFYLCDDCYECLDALDAEQGVSSAP